MAGVRLLALLFAASAFAADPVGFPIWPNENQPDKESIQTGPKDDIRRVNNVTRPTITPFFPPAGKANGASVIVLPGGGWRILAIDKEGYDVARWLNTIGVTAFVVKYRVMETGKTTPQDVLEAKRKGAEDALEAVRIVRTRAKEWNVDPKRIGVVGFSAGGYHAAMTAMKFNAENRPDFVACIYPAVTETLDVPSNAPPVFFFAADDDRLTPAGNSVPLYLAMKKAKVSAEMHIVTKGGHGFGMVKSGNPTDFWTDRYAEWMKGLKVLSQ